MDYQKVMYVIIFLLFIPLTFNVLRAMKIEKYFEQGKVLQIRLAYAFLTLIFSELATQVVERIFSLS